MRRRRWRRGKTIKMRRRVRVRVMNLYEKGL